MKTELLVPVQFETHLFKGEANDFPCTVCGKGRSQHLHDGFAVRKTPSTQCMDSSIRYGRTQPRNRVMFGYTQKQFERSQRRVI